MAEEYRLRPLHENRAESVVLKHVPPGVESSRYVGWCGAHPSPFHAGFGFPLVLWTPILARQCVGRFTDGGRKRRRFSPEFKLEAVKLVKEGGVSVAQAARDLEIYETSLRRWIKQYEIDRGQGPSGSLTTAEKEELRRLRREVRTLRMEREILKKATAFFAKEGE